MRRAEAPAPQVVPASRLINETLVLSFLQSDSRCRQYVRDLSSVTSITKILGSIREWEWLAIQLHGKLTFCFPVGKMEYRRYCFCVAEFQPPFLEVRL